MTADAPGRERPPSWRVRDLFGLGRSLATYYLKPGRSRNMRQMYARFVARDGLCFDIGAHVGSRTRCFRALGARVVAIEPQPRFASFLGWLFRNDVAVVVLPLAVAGRAGAVDLRISTWTPTVSTASPRFQAAVSDVPSFRSVVWDEHVSVPTVTLDHLIAQHGLPDFVKIDVEGMEDEVLSGLSYPVRGLSFEMLPAHRQAAMSAIARLNGLGRYRFNVSLGESMRFLWPDWADAARLHAWLESLERDASSGDVYAKLEPAA